MSSDEETARKQAYNDWVATDSKENLKTAILRLAWTQSDREVPADKEKGHWVDVELAADVISKMPGPKPSYEYLMTIAEALRDNDNWRPLSHARNTGIDRDTAALIMENKPVTLTGHQLNKTKEQVEWLVEHKDELPPGYVAKMGDMLANVKDEQTGRSVMDQRRLKGAGSDYTPGVKSAASLQRDIDTMTTQVASMEISAEKKAALAPLIASGDVKLTREGAIDKRSAAVKRGDVIVTDAGGLDGRSAIVRSAASSSSSSSSSTSVHAAPSSAPIAIDGLRYKTDGTVDQRSAAVRSGAVLVTNSGHIDGRSAAVRSGGGGSSSGYGGGGGGGPCKADGTPDMRFSANRR